jgi:hypothetical protein
MRQPLNVRISKLHHAKIDELRDAGLALYAIIEQGVDSVYERMVEAHLVEGSARQCAEDALADSSA